MATEIYIGNIPDNISNWIKKHSKKHSDTRITYTASSGLPPWSSEISGEITQSMISNVYNIETIEIGNTVSSIGVRAFSNALELTDLYLPDSVVRIEEGAFYSAWNLTSLNLPSSITYIAGDSDYKVGAFQACSNLKLISLPRYCCAEPSATINCWGQNEIVLSAIVKNDVSTISAFTFDRCYNIEYIEIPSTVEEIEDGAFGDNGTLSCVMFKGRTLDQISSMNNYPWYIHDVSAISAEL